MSNPILFFSEQLQKQLDPKKPEDIVNVQRGLLLYRQDMVYQSAEEGTVLSGAVQDVVPCSVELDLQTPEKSRCSCNQQLYCRHQLAVFFTAYSKIRSVSEWVQTWKSGQTRFSSESLQLQKAKELLRDEKPVELTYESWKEFMADMYKKQVAYHLSLSTYQLTTKWDQYIQRVKAKMPLENEWKLLYTFIMYFQTFLLTMQTLKKEGLGYSTSQFLQREADELEERIHYTAEQLARSSRPFAFDAFYQGIRADMHELLDPYVGLDGSSIDIYRTIWTHLLKEKTWRRDEFIALTHRLQETERNGSEDGFDCMEIAAIHLALLMEKEDTVMNLLEELRPKNYPLLAYWVRYFDEQKAVPFILFIMRHIHDYYEVAPNIYRRKEFVQFFIPHIKRYCQRMKKLEQFEKFCENTLPYSFVQYSHYLLDHEKFKKWVELYLFSTHADLEYIPSDELKMVANSEPTLLLPIYTSIVQEKIENKNRQSYKAAVRYLKKIKSIYKKEKQLDVWELYIQKIQSSHTRLRAFQEELKRGKLIHVE
ncbi:SWIM zinc finger family protein [Bacillus testis]|uniref:SWIM zinc finger family protein n=1 Tax=Bacillus testis TaxID=1622072 RepID=UPI000A5C129E|nr:SWIM zinc finger family protein [Bacillus testis]